MLTAGAVRRAQPDKSAQLLLEEINGAEKSTASGEPRGVHRSVSMHSWLRLVSQVRAQVLANLQNHIGECLSLEALIAAPAGDSAGAFMR
jgi:hypothetical protein